MTMHTTMLIMTKTLMWPKWRRCPKVTMKGDNRESKEDSLDEDSEEEEAVIWSPTLEVAARRVPLLRSFISLGAPMGNMVSQFL
ncbi:hypothetical protein GUJ93_ZPchr0005g14432 [Zizania palustris]|uniref:Uncharacterized protein n=1 Tax=Zizania palustris TaxID=103762 RepID=A0A8J5SH86_ZIZPA|nr:hypothetical protein GUJ93_ZPchr0005g14432 [Zizania palustris]